MVNGQWSIINSQLSIVNCQLSILSLPPPPRCEGIDPSDAGAEPAEGSHLLASETENEVTIGVTAIGQSHIDKAEVLSAFLVGMFDGTPNSDGIRVEQRIALSQ